MKPLCMLLLLTLLPGYAAYAQETDNVFTVSGTVVDSRTRKAVESAYVMLSGTKTGTVTNADGFFSLKIRRPSASPWLEITCLGYATVRLPVDGMTTDHAVIYLTASPVAVGAVTVHNIDARELVARAIARIGDNYSDQASLMTGFYRETVQKRQHYIEVSEAVGQIYKTPYSRDIYGDRMRILKGRSLVSTNRRDTISVKFTGGPVLIIDNDMLKARGVIFDHELFEYYNLAMEHPQAIDDRMHHVVSMVPNADVPWTVMFFGRLYIDMETLAFSRIELQADMGNRDKVTSAVLRSKPAGLRFTPNELTFTLSYRSRAGRSYLSYIKYGLRFRCDWRKRLFSTNYSVVCETVITDGQDTSRVPFTASEAFKSSHILSERIGSFYDEGFWEDYNIIEPSESLESAVARLRKQQD